MSRSGDDLIRQFPIGSAVMCRDGRFGQLRRIVVDPIAMAVTHLVVEPEHHSGEARLVPVGLVDRTTEDELLLVCDRDKVADCEFAEETDFLGHYLDEGSNGVLAWPYYGLGTMGTGATGIGLGAPMPLTVTYDRVPLGEVEIHRHEPVQATDGEIGKVDGLVVDKDHHVTHVLLQEGHLWGRKQVAIPISVVTSVEDGIHVALTKAEIEDLPPVELAELRRPDTPSS